MVVTWCDAEMFGSLRSWISAHTLKSLTNRTAKFGQTVCEKKKPPMSWRVYPQAYLLGEKVTMQYFILAKSGLC